jgi:hypothetical protein
MPVIRTCYGKVVLNCGPNVRLVKTSRTLRFFQHFSPFRLSTQPRQKLFPFHSDNATDLPHSHHRYLPFSSTTRVQIIKMTTLDGSSTSPSADHSYTKYECINRVDTPAKNVPHLHPFPSRPSPHASQELGKPHCYGRPPPSPPSPCQSIGSDTDPDSSSALAFVLVQEPMVKSTLRLVVKQISEPPLQAHRSYTSPLLFSIDVRLCVHPARNRLSPRQPSCHYHQLLNRFCRPRSMSAPVLLMWTPIYGESP